MPQNMRRLKARAAKRKTAKPNDPLDQVMKQLQSLGLNKEMVTQLISQYTASPEQPELEAPGLTVLTRAEQECAGGDNQNSATYRALLLLAQATPVMESTTTDCTAFETLALQLKSLSWWAGQLAQLAQAEHEELAAAMSSYDLS